MKGLKLVSVIIIVVGGVAALIIKPGSGPILLGSYNFLPRFDSSMYVGHTFYSLSYNEEHEQPNWVAYTIKPGMLVTNVERPGYFRNDTMVKTGTATQADYFRSGYDRGHMVPAADMQFDSLAVIETFYYSNISPQLPGYNRGIWRSLEQMTRDKSKEFDSLIVITGPVFSEPSEKIGENGVSVPNAFYKILIQFYGNNVTATSYLVPHLNGLSDLSDYIVSIDSIEGITGIDFLSDLPVKLEAKLEGGK